MELEKILKQRRKELSLTQDELAERIHVSRQTISNWETGKTLPDVSSLLLISENYQLPLDDLLIKDKQVRKKIEQDSNELKLFRTNKKIKEKVGFIGVSLSMVVSCLIWSTYLFNYKAETGALPLLGCTFTGIMAILFLEMFDSSNGRTLLVVLNSLIILSFPLLLLIALLLGF